MKVRMTINHESMTLWIEQNGYTDEDVRTVLDFMRTLYKFGILKVINE